MSPERITGACGAEEPVFGAPWEARVFALVVKLHEAGVFTWPEWVAALSDEIARMPPFGSRYAEDSAYAPWLAALENLLVARGITSRGLIGLTKNAWDEVARVTPHGKPIELETVLQAPER